MKRKRIVAGNWKMNNSLQQAESLVREILSASNEDDGVEKIFFPPFPYLLEVASWINGRKDIQAGAQNCNEHEKGAFTGEVSASMIRSCGGKFVIIGHSERRSLYGETEPILLKKIQQALAQDLNIIYCFGEQILQRQSEVHFETVERQLKPLFNALSKTEWSSVILAYEPVWAIGTGVTATPAQAQEMHAFIRALIGSRYGEDIAGGTSILYGGSCNAGNAASLFSMADVDGGLIGGASLNSAEFCRIAASF
jgi:triosephosphate isomerase